MLASWSSSAPPVATVTSQGLVQTVSPGDVNISATIGNVLGSAPLSVNSTTDGLVFISDMTDPRLVSYTGTDGSSAMLYGTRDNSGIPAALTGVSATTAAGNQAQFLLDSQGRPQSVALSDGSRLLYSWSTAGSGMATLIGSDGVATISVPIDMPPSSASNNASDVTAAARAKASASSTDSASPPALTFNVASCNGQIPEDFATIVINPAGTLIPVPFSGVSGVYSTLLPSGIGAAASSLQAGKQFFGGNICLIPNLVGTTCKVVTVALVLAGDGIPALEAPALYSECTELGQFGNVVSNVCTAISATSTITSSINWLDSQLPIPYRASLASLAPIIGGTQPPSGGVYPPNNVDFACPNVDHVDVLPSNLTLGVGEEVPLVATARDANDKVLFSSAFQFNWSGGEQSPYLLSSPNFQGENPFATDTISGTSTGGPVTIGATETSSGKSGSSEVTVASNTYSFTTLDYPGAAETYPLAIDNLGDVVGYYMDTAGNSHGFLYSGGSYTSLDPPGSINTSAQGINNYGQIVGWWQSTEGPDFGFLYSGGSYTNLNGSTSGIGINDAGQIIVDTGNPDFADRFDLYSGGSYSPLALPGGPVGINNAGQIVGYGTTNYPANGMPSNYALNGLSFIYNFNDGSVQNIAAPNSGCWIGSRLINNLGAFVGRLVQNPNNQSPEECPQDGENFVYLNGSFTPISFPSGWNQPPATVVTTNGINDFGVITGIYVGSDYRVHGFIGVPQ